MRYTVDRSDDHAVLRLHEDRLDVTNSGDFKGEMLILSSSGIAVLFIDFSEVDYCDSSGLGAMLLVHREMKNAGGYAIFVGLTERVATLIKIAQLDQVLYIYDSKEEALADLESNSDEGEHELG